jgi:hypothetical protein
MISIGWSDFAAGRYHSGSPHSYFRGEPRELVELVQANWERRQPGAGRDGLDQVVLVPCPSDRFVCSTTSVDEKSTLTARFQRRQPDENGYVEVRSSGPRENARFANVVLYSAATLLLNSGKRSGNCDWEIVSIQAAAVEKEPMHPLTMARNQLSMSGGTPCLYSADEFARAIWYWSDRCGVEPGEPDR